MPCESPTPPAETGRPRRRSGCTPPGPTNRPPSPIPWPARASSATAALLHRSSTSATPTMPARTCGPPPTSSAGSALSDPDVERQIPNTELRTLNSRSGAGGRRHRGGRDGQIGRCPGGSWGFGGRRGGGLRGSGLGTARGRGPGRRLGNGEVITVDRNAVAGHVSAVLVRHQDVCGGGDPGADLGRISDRLGEIVASGLAHRGLLVLHVPLARVHRLPPLVLGCRGHPVASVDVQVIAAPHVGLGPGKVGLVPDGQGVTLKSG